MSNFKIVPLQKDYAERIRVTKTDAFGLNTLEQVATGAGPCRLSLKPFDVGVDKRLLFKHSPFENQSAYNQSGPVFIHADAVEEYSDIYRFPPEIKKAKDSIPLSLIGYDAHHQMVFAQRVGDEDVDFLIERIFDEQADIEYFHARNSEACCYICKIERNH